MVWWDTNGGIIPQAVVPQRISPTIFAIVLLAAIASGGICLGAEPKKKIPPVPLPLVPVVQEWEAALDDLPSAGGAMDDERIYIPIQPEKIVAISRSRGEKVWTRDIESMWPPVVIGNSVYVAASDEIHALNAATGEQLWRVPFDGPMTAPLVAATIRASTGSGRPEPVEGRAAGSGTGSDLLVATFAKGRVIAFAAGDGQMVWMRDLGAQSRFVPALDGSRAFFALDDTRIVALRLADGRVEWEQKLEGVLSQPSFTRDRVFVGSNMNLLFALDNASGRLAWRWKTGGDVIGTSGDAKGGAYYASLDNVLRAVNRGNGNQRWIKEIPTRPLMPPQTFGDGMKYEEIVVLTGVTSEIDAFAAKDGMLVGTYMPPSDLQGAPLIDPVLQPYRVAMVVITRDGRAFGLKPSAMLLPEPTATPLTGELPGRRLDRERITQQTR
jgi:outer membrane protein assembly factor BamB